MAAAKQEMPAGSPFAIGDRVRHIEGDHSDQFIVAGGSKDMVYIDSVEDGMQCTTRASFLEKVPVEPPTHEELKADADAEYAKECTAHPEFKPEMRTIGVCKKCKRPQIEYTSHTGIRCYNAQMSEKHQIVWSGARYYCRTCASPSMIKKHDRTF